MSTAIQQAPFGPAATPDPSVTAVPFTRLIRVELRKLWDTRAGFWLLAGIGLITAAVIVIFMFAGAAEELTFNNFVNATTWPQAILLPVLGILAVTSEWGQRTGLVTFTLEPHRERIVLAKLAATLALGVAAVVVALGLAAVANVVAASGLQGNGSWTFGLEGARDVFLNQLIGVLQGAAFGMLLMNSAAAIVAFFALPTVWGILSSTVEWFADVGRWMDLNTTSTPS
jgi:ABC-2 type transport system permease protein